LLVQVLKRIGQNRHFPHHPAQFQYAWSVSGPHYPGHQASHEERYRGREGWGQRVQRGKEEKRLLTRMVLYFGSVFSPVRENPWYFSRNWAQVSSSLGRGVRFEEEQDDDEEEEMKWRKKRKKKKKPLEIKQRKPKKMEKDPHQHPPCNSVSGWH